MPTSLLEYTITTEDISLLAIHYRIAYLHLEFHEFIEGHSENFKFEMLQEFEAKCRFLNSERVAEIRKASERRVASETGELWQVFVYACDPGMIESKPEMPIVMKVTDALLGNYPKDEIVEQYSLEFYETLKQATEEQFQRLSEHMENLADDLFDDTIDEPTA